MFRIIQKFPYYTMRAARKGIAWAYAAPETWQRRTARAPLYQFHRLVSRVLKPVEPCTYITSGISLASGQPLKAAFVGRWESNSEPSIQRYEDAIFQMGSAARREIGPFRGSFRRQAERNAHQVDLVVMAGDPAELSEPPQGDWALSQVALCRVFDFLPGESWQQVLDRSGMAPLRDRLEGSGFRYYLSHRQADFSSFYHEIYTPTVLKLHHGYIERMAEPEARVLFEDNGAVLLIEGAAGQVVAGALVSAAYSTAHRWLAGVLEGSAERALNGALEACDYFGMQWAFAAGCQQFDGGISLPFSAASPGSAGSARQLPARGVRYVIDPWHPEKVLFWAPPGSQAGAAWLKASPFHPFGLRTGGDDLPERDFGEAPQAETAHSVPATGALARTADGPEQIVIESYGKITKEISKPVDHGLYEHALAAIGPEVGRVFKSFSIAVRGEHNQVIGGLIGRITWNYMHIDSLWVSADYRGHHLGTRLMNIAENTARKENLKYITVETTSFEAIGFYPRLGYEVIAQLDDVPPGHTFYYLKKKL